MTRTQLIATCTCLCMLSLASSVGATVILPNLPAGTQYQIIFRTEGEYFGFFSAEGYNILAASQAADSAALPVATWHAVVSTPLIDANVNAPSPGLPVYNTHGQLVAPAGLYGEHTASVNYDQFGTAWSPDLSILVWTGSASDGSAAQPLGGSSATVGDFVIDPYFWASFGSAPTNETVKYPIYALSTPLTAVPEPQTLVLIVLAVAALPLARAVARRKRYFTLTAL